MSKRPRLVKVTNYAIAFNRKRHRSHYKGSLVEVAIMAEEKIRTGKVHAGNQKKCPDSEYVWVPAENFFSRASGKTRKRKPAHANVKVFLRRTNTTIGDLNQRELIGFEAFPKPKPNPSDARHNNI